MASLLKTEAMKWRGTPFLWVTVAAALTPALLVVLLAIGSSYMRTWDSFFEQVLLWYTIFAGPLTATLIGAQTMTSEYQHETWKLALIAPVPRWRVYGAKTVHGALWLLGLSVVAWLGGWAGGYASGVGEELRLVRWFGLFLLGGLGLATMLPFYQAVAAATRSFFVTSGAGIVLTFAGLFTLQSKYGGLFPISAVPILVRMLHGLEVPQELIGGPVLWAFVPVAVGCLAFLTGLLYFERTDL